MTVLYAAWLLLSLAFLGLFLRDRIAELRGASSGRSWCLDCAENLRCDCPVSGRL